MWALLAPQITRALDAAEFDDIAPLEQRLASLFTPWIDGRIDAREFMRRLAIVDAMHAERDPAYRAQQREMTAYHEAGHAIVAHLLGCQVNAVTIRPTSADMAFGHVRYNPPLGQSAEDDCLITLAGPLAQAMGGYLGGMEEHRRQCNGRLLDGSPGVSVAARMALLKYIEIRALEIVNGHWPAITRVAERLLAEETLDGVAFLAAAAPADSACLPAVP